MKFTLEQLRNTKAGQAASNQKLIAEAIKSKGAAADILHMGSVGYPVVQSDVSRPLDRKRRARQNGPVSLVAIVTIIRVSYSECDDDSIPPGAKALRDCIAASLGVDDGDKRIRWRYAQVRVDDGRTGTIVKIDQV